MPGGAARHEAESIEPRQIPVLEAELGDQDLAGVRVDAIADRVADRPRLLRDLLEHEVRVAALLGGLGVPRDRGALAPHRGAVETTQGGVVAGDDGHVPVFQNHDVARLAHERRDVGGDEGLSLAESDHERGAAAADRHQLIRRVLGNADERVRALEPLARQAHGLGQAVGPVVLDEVGDDLGVGLGAEVMALGGERLAQLAVVVDDPVVDDGEARPAVHVRMRVGVAGAPVGGPSRVRDPHGPPRVPAAGHERLERGDLSDRLAHVEARPVDGGDPGGVVPPVFEAAKGGEQEGHGLALTDVSDDATHG